MCNGERASCSAMSESLSPHGLYHLRNSPGQNAGVGSLIPSPGALPNTPGELVKIHVFQPLLPRTLIWLVWGGAQESLF